MAYTKKKRRKSRKPQQFEAPVTDDEKAKIQYKDDFQKTYGSRIEQLGNKLDGKGKQILYGLAAVGVLLVLVGMFYTYQRRQNNTAQLELGNAIETYQAQVTDSPLPAGSTQKTFKTEKERAEASISEFQAVADKFGGSYAEKAKYFIAVNRLVLDREAGITELESLSSSGGEVGNMAKFALAQAKSSDGKLDEAAKLYQELAASGDSVIAKETINFDLAAIYEKQDKPKEAVELYFNIAKTASEAKTADDKPVPLTQTAQAAKAKVEELDPEKAKEIKEQETPAPPMPLG